MLRPIYYSRLDTQNTKIQIRIHNGKWDLLCLDDEGKPVYVLAPKTESEPSEPAQ